MDATSRWETEAIRSSSRKRASPPRPTAKRHSDAPIPGTWLTLKEAETETGIPTNTLRKWVRRDTVESYLESDGELSLRMVKLDSVIARAEALGRKVERQPSEQRQPVKQHVAKEPSGTAERTEDGSSPTDQRPALTEPDEQVSDETSDSEAITRGNHGTGDAPGQPEPVVPQDSMLVPIDAWNKMINQLGNLHDAGQQLAEARERAAKAETEALFLRERLAELRQIPLTVTTDPPVAARIEDPVPDGDPVAENPVDLPAESVEALEIADTTTYWRYLTTGWRDRKRRGNR